MKRTENAVQVQQTMQRFSTSKASQLGISFDESGFLSKKRIKNHMVLLDGTETA